MSDRYFAANLEAVTQELVLTGDQAHHLRSVCRGRPGDLVELFNGAGLHACCEVVALGRKEARLRPLDVKYSPLPDRQLVLACAMPKGDRASMLVEKCVELDVGRLVPLTTHRSVADPGAGRLEKLRRVGIEACKQSGRNHLMQIDEPIPWLQFAAHAAQGTRWMLHPGAGQTIPDQESSPTTIAVGPEGGWTDEELGLGDQHDWQAVRLPGNTLRVETAAMTAAAWFRLRS